jgi:hypothetical protein
VLHGVIHPTVVLYYIFSVVDMVLNRLTYITDPFCPILKASNVVILIMLSAALGTMSMQFNLGQPLVLSTLVGVPPLKDELGLSGVCGDAPRPQPRTQLEGHVVWRGEESRRPHHQVHSDRGVLRGAKPFRAAGVE